MNANCFPLTVLLVISAIALTDDNDAPKDQPKFKIATKRKDDAVKAWAGKDKTVFDVKSPFGISQAVIERESEKWPHAVEVRCTSRAWRAFGCPTAR
jgi:hypothetical protein